jgi:photosystem II stability/assembly factor-like uncharacterized protein
MTTSMSADGNKVIAGNTGVNNTWEFGSLYISADGGSTWAITQPDWESALLPWQTTSMSADGNIIIAGYEYADLAVKYGRLFITNNGGSWWFETQPAGARNIFWQTSSMSADGTKIIVGSQIMSGTGSGTGRLWLTTNTGTTWSVTNPAGDVDLNWNTTSMSADGSRILASVLNGGIYYSSNGGNSWTQLYPTGVVENKSWRTTSMSGDGTKMIAGIMSGRLYFTEQSNWAWSETQPAGNNNMGWITTSMNPDASKMIVGVSGGRLYLNNKPLPVSLYSFSGITHGNDVSLTWKTTSETNNAGFFIEKSECGIQNSEWKNVGFVKGKGTTNTETNYMFEDKKLATGKYKYRLKQIDYNGNFEYHNLSGEVEVGVPKKYELSQNYPNPFNPMTKIDFQLPMDGKVSLVIYDITGREIATLLNNEFKKADYYTVMFNGSNFSSGVYFYRITADKYVMTKKMVLLK